MKCLQCGSDRIARNVRLRESHQHTKIVAQTFDNPEAIFFKGTRSYPVLANICSDCGYVMLTLPTNDAQSIYETVRRTG